MLCRRDKIVGQLELSRGRDTSRERKDLLVEMSLFITSTDATLADKTATSSISEGNRSSIADPKAVKSKPSSSTSSMADSDKSPPRNISADSSTDSDVSKADPRSLPKIFSRRAIECRVGSIHDFVAVLLSPGTAL